MTNTNRFKVDLTRVLTDRDRPPKGSSLIPGLFLGFLSLCSLPASVLAAIEIPPQPSPWTYDLCRDMGAYVDEIACRCTVLWGGEFLGLGSIPVCRNAQMLTDEARMEALVPSFAECMAGDHVCPDNTSVDPLHPWLAAGERLPSTY